MTAALVLKGRAQTLDGPGRRPGAGGRGGARERESVQRLVRRPAGPGAAALGAVSFGGQTL
jgi:hypothetical protein